MTGTLLSVQVGMPQTMRMAPAVARDQFAAQWTSGIFKTPVGRVWVSRDIIAGDGQADPRHHGGPDNVVLAYDAAHYAAWRAELARPDLPFGSFGENFTVEGYSDDNVCIGDVWQVGGPDALLLQVTQARQPCWKLARRLEYPLIVKRVMELGWGGWYLRVLREGFAEAGMAIEQIAHPHPEWPVREAVWTMYGKYGSLQQAQALAELPELSTRWKNQLLGT